MDEESGFEVLCLAGGVGYAEEWVDGVTAAAVDDGAGGAEEGAAEGGVLDCGFLVGEEAVAPGFEELGVEIVLRVGLSRSSVVAKATPVLKAVAAAAESWSIWRRVKVGLLG